RHPLPVRSGRSRRAHGNCQRRARRRPDRLPNPNSRQSNPYVPTNSPAIGDLFDLFNFSNDQGNSGSNDQGSNSNGDSGSNRPNLPKEPYARPIGRAVMPISNLAR